MSASEDGKYHNFRRTRWPVFAFSLSQSLAGHKSKLNAFLSVFLVLGKGGRAGSKEPQKENVYIQHIVTCCGQLGSRILGRNSAGNCSVARANKY